MMDYQEICLAVCETAKKAGAFIREQREVFSFDKVEHKGTQDLVSYVDKQAEKIIVADLSRLLPEAGFITEEGTVEKATNQRYRWVIDPLDGTTNFIHGLPPYCVSIALCDGDMPVVGVVYEVKGDECFYGWKGSKAYLNAKEIKVSTIDKMENALFAVGLSHSSQETIARLLENMDYLLRHTNGIRRIGSAAADLVYVAASRFEGFYQCNLSPWDVAAGALIVECAGGQVTDYSGGNNYVFGREIVATNKLIHEDFKNSVV